MIIPMLADLENRTFYPCSEHPQAGLNSGDVIVFQQQVSTRPTMKESSKRCYIICLL